MKTISLHQVDTFTDQLFGGNPAGVVTNADALTVEDMVHIAREMNLSETAFVMQPSLGEADVRLRFFTPTADEIKFCGHATVGALFQLAQLNLFNLGQPGENKVRVETNAGVLDMTVTNSGGASQVTFIAPPVALQSYRLQGDVFAEECGVALELIKSGGTILLDRTLNYLYIPTSSLKALGDQTFDFARIREKFGAEGIVVFCFFADETINPEANVHARGLAPNVGIDEDPFTGSMQAGLVHAAKQNGYLSVDQQHIVTEQGNFIGRPGSATINHDSRSDTFNVTASAVRVFSTEIEL